jgi:hypothetical protein
VNPHHSTHNQSLNSLPTYPLEHQTENHQFLNTMYSQSKHQIIHIQPFGHHPKQGIKIQHYHPKPSTNDPTKSTHHNPIKSKIPKINQQNFGSLVDGRVLGCGLAGNPSENGLQMPDFSPGRRSWRIGSHDFGGFIGFDSWVAGLSSWLVGFGSWVHRISLISNLTLSASASLSLFGVSRV